MKGAYYNEHDPFAAEWLRNLIAAGHIAPGDVDERDVREVQPEDLSGYAQAHFFAGIGVWSYALRLAGWPDDRPVWTGSCPCQPFSTAGKRKGTDDDRHLWPLFFRLIQECKPPVVLGEQVASKDGLGWLDVVRANMEGANYAFGAVDLCAASVGAPHIRQRLWFVGLADESSQRLDGGQDSAGARGWHRSEDGRDDGGVGHAAGEREEAVRGTQQGSESEFTRGRGSAHRSSWLEFADGERCQEQRLFLRERRQGPAKPEVVGHGEGGGGSASDSGLEDDGPTRGFWRDPDWVLCRDPGGPRWRPIEPGSFPLAHGASAQVGRLRAYGNAIVAPLAAEFIRAALTDLE